VPDPVDAETDVANVAVEQKRLDSALDRLRQGLPKRSPLALVGHDFGAMHGLGLAARRPVFAATVVIVATPRWADWFLRFWRIEGDRYDYLRRLAPFDPVTTVRELKGALLWQFSDRDFFIAPMAALELVRAGPSDPGIQWYKSDHAMRSSRARADRAAFLARELRLG
jgi:pimeloyl-ACP methyl ester carboxylesterase